MIRYAALAALAALASSLWPSAAHAWGERGHHAIARNAALAVLVGVPREPLAGSEAGLLWSVEAFFRKKALQLAHLSNIPDTAWRNSDPETQAINAPTHFLDADQLTQDFDAIPLEYPAALKKFHGKKNRLDKKKTIDLYASGTLIWRAQELYDLAVADFQAATAAAPGSPQYVDAVKNALRHLGLLAHFVGDATMPYHNATDYDGWATGNGGIHAYFESDIPDTQAPDLELDVYKKLPELYAAAGIEELFRKGGSRPASFLTREIGKRAFARIPELQRLDDAHLLERSTPGEGGRRGTPAARKAPEAAAPDMRPMITEQMALASAALARLWRGAWEAGGRPDLSYARFWDYHHKPEFVVPAYDPAAVERIKQRAEK